MDLLYLFRHSAHGDEELRYSLRSVERHVPWVEKVWILGDRPAWLTSDTELLTVVPHAGLVGRFGWEGAQTNFFRLMVLGAAIGGLSEEFLLMCDDYVLLDTLTESDARREWCHKDLAGETKREGLGSWREQLWRTIDELGRRGLPRVNFEPHRPQRLTKSRILAAHEEFRDLCCEPMREGVLGLTATLNLALAREGFPLTKLAEHGRHAGFHRTAPTLEAVRAACAGQACLNFDDGAYGPGLRRFLAEAFPAPSRYEAADAAPIDPVPITPSVPSPVPSKAMPMSASDRPVRPTVPARSAKAASLDYANVCRVTGTPEELILDFALQTDPSAPIGPADRRVVLSPRTAKRVAAALTAAVSHHEKLFGPLETDLTRRLQATPSRPVPPVERRSPALAAVAAAPPAEVVTVEHEGRSVPITVA